MKQYHHFKPFRANIPIKILRNTLNLKIFFFSCHPTLLTSKVKSTKCLQAARKALMQRHWSSISICFVQAAVCPCARTVLIFIRLRVSTGNSVTLTKHILFQFAELARMQTKARTPLERQVLGAKELNFSFQEDGFIAQKLQ